MATDGSDSKPNQQQQQNQKRNKNNKNIFEAVLDKQDPFLATKERACWS